MVFAQPLVFTALFFEVLPTTQTPTAQWLASSKKYRRIPWFKMHIRHISSLWQQIRKRDHLQQQVPHSSACFWSLICIFDACG